jgi:hypothetical protein
MIMLTMKGFASGNFKLTEMDCSLSEMVATDGDMVDLVGPFD